MASMCEQCHERPHSVRFGSQSQYRHLCLRCYNNGLAEERGIDFEHNDFEAAVVTDARGVERTFEFETFHFVSGVSLTAFEVRGGERRGYAFKVIGDPECEPFELFGRLFQKIQRGLSRQHLLHGRHGISIGDNNVARGRVECDRDMNGRQPVVVIDGEELSWEQFGELLMGFEGFQFKLEIRDMAEEL